VVAGLRKFLDLDYPDYAHMRDLLLYFFENSLYPLSKEKIFYFVICPWDARLYTDFAHGRGFYVLYVCSCPSSLSRLCAYARPLTLFFKNSLYPLSKEKIFLLCHLSLGCSPLYRLRAWARLLCVVSYPDYAFWAWPL